MPEGPTHSQPDHVDVLIVGAGLSGIGAACHLQAECPGKTYAILEGRDAIGGTWDLFRYPGIRSDSDMFTLGYSFRPWTDAKAIADGPSILSYVRDTAREHGVEAKIVFGHQVTGAEWSSDEARWTVEAEHDGDTVELTCSFLYLCTGYYRYEEGYTPEFAGAGDFQGEVVHPQHWPEDLDYSGRKVVVIGSGATAVTLVPAMAGDAAHVTMLQRSPSYIAVLPSEDPIANALRRLLPAKAAYFLARWKNVLLQLGVYRLSKWRPQLMKAVIRRNVERQLPPGYDIDRHFKPKYDPWDERLCLVPDADLFKAIGDGKATVVTDEIDSFTKTGIRLASGHELEAEVIVTATGLNLVGLAGLDLTVDGEKIPFPEKMAYKGLMLSDVPNFAFAVGYTNASWTLKADLTSKYVCRLLTHMDANGYSSCVPRNRDPSVTDEPFIDLASGYVLRSLDQLPKQGSKEPWRLRQNYPRDVITLRHGEIEDGVLEFSRARSARVPQAATSAAPSS